jgi:hypothetical protein
MVLNLAPGDQGVMGQVMCEAEGLDVFLDSRGYDPLVPPELVSLQIRLHSREVSLDLLELWVRNFGNPLASFSPLGHDVVEVEDKSLGVVRDIPAGLIIYIKSRRGVERESDDGSGFQALD